MSGLKDKYCFVGVGETAYSKAAGRTPLSMACEAILKAAADAGLDPRELDGLTSYSIGDSTTSQAVAGALGLRLNYGVDIEGGGSSVEALVANAIGVLEGGYARSMVVWRSALGRSGVRFGGQSASGGPSTTQVGYRIAGLGSLSGINSPAQITGIMAMEHMRKYGTTTRQLAEVAVAYRFNASLNPKATMKSLITVEDHQQSRWIAKPYRLLDCCLESDVANAIIIVPKERAYDLRQPPVFIKGGLARKWNKPIPGWSTNPGHYGAQRVWSSTGHRPSDMDFTSAYDAFTWTSMVQFELYGFCGEGEGGDYVSGGRLRVDGQRPSNTGGGQLSEGYTNGINLLIEDIRQLRHRADDSCTRWMDGLHTYDRAQGCRQLREANLCIGMGYGSHLQCSCVVMGNATG